MYSNRSHLHLASLNLAIEPRQLTRRERTARRTELGMVSHDGGLAASTRKSTAAGAGYPRSAWDEMPSDCNPY